ncbi:aminoacetone oxidase family FAD-binding enzyme [Candidatus Nomurabacteria bacterium]|nr:aminoacetone oxidase family FAD-binding enzyme [Candidatus Nomurabacteria bacterium]
MVFWGGGPLCWWGPRPPPPRGRSVLLLEKNNELGKKLSITGGGRCNVTNNKLVVREMLSMYKDSGKYLFSTFMQFGVKETIDWFKERNVDFIEENEGRLFPSTQKAETIRQTLINELEKTKVELKLCSIVSGINYNKKKEIFNIETLAGSINARSCVVTTGGTSRPETGSSGEGFEWLQKLGHTVVTNNMALVPLMINAKWISSLAGVSLPEVKITLFSNSKKDSAHKGKLLFTHVGVTGPTVLNLSKKVGELLEDGKVELKVDLVPDLDAGELKQKLTKVFSESSNKKIKNVLSEFVPTAVGKVILSLVGVDEETPCHSVTKESRKQILTSMKSFVLPVKGLLGPDKAVVSSGGVSLDEVNFKTMESKVIKGLYFAGDVLNINRPSGGYSLQLCWSTGFVAGSSV